MLTVGLGACPCPADFFGSAPRAGTGSGCGSFHPAMPASIPEFPLQGKLFSAHLFFHLKFMIKIKILIN